MNIYLLRARENVSYDSYDAHVVQANSKYLARRSVPHGDEIGWDPDNRVEDFWTSDEHSSCELIGFTVKDEHEAGVILSSFNAG